MARVEIPIVVQDGNGNALSEAQVTIVNRATGTPPTVYQTATGGATRALPLTTAANGRPPSSWVERGPYTVTATATAIGTESYAWDAAAAGDGSVGTGWLDLNPITELAVPEFVTALPASPVDGKRAIYLADGAQGVLWQLRYRAAASGPYKWECLGGTPLSSEITTSQATTSTSYTNLTTVGPDVTVPLAGDYLVRLGVNGLNGINNCFMSYALGAAAAVDEDGTGAFGATKFARVERTNRKDSLAAGTLLRAKYRTEGSGGTTPFYNRLLSIMPIRVAG